MTGGGDYDRNARVQATARRSRCHCSNAPLARPRSPPPPAPVAVVDYGSATGKNSMPVLAAALKVIRLRTPQPVPVRAQRPAHERLRVVVRDAGVARRLPGRRRGGVCVRGGEVVLRADRSGRLVSLGWSSTAATGCRGCPRRSPIARGRPRRGRPAPSRSSPRRAAIGAVFSICARPRRAPVAGWSSSSRPSTTTASVAANMPWTVSTKRCAPRSRMEQSPGTRPTVWSCPNFFLSREELEAPFGEPALRGRLQLVEHLRVITRPAPGRIRARRRCRRPGGGLRRLGPRVLAIVAAGGAGRGTERR